MFWCILQSCVKTTSACLAWALSLAKCQLEHDNYDEMHVRKIKCACPEVLIPLTKSPVREQIQWIVKTDNYRNVCIKECGVHSHDPVNIKGINKCKRETAKDLILYILT